MSDPTDPLPPERRLQIDQVREALRTREIGRDLRYLRVAESTMIDARRLAEAGGRHGAVVVADEQTAGRGTKGRAWLSAPGRSIHATLIVRPDAEQMKRLSIVSAVATAQAVERATGLAPRLKWPNDVELRRRKFGGILIEGEWRADGPAWALVGIGVNVNFDPAPHAAQIDRPATSLMLELGREAPREAVLAELLNAFEEAYDNAASDEAFDAVFRAWRSRLDTLGREVRIVAPGGETIVEGVAEDAAFDGALLVRDAGGRLHTITAGEVSLREA